MTDTHLVTVTVGTTHLPVDAADMTMDRTWAPYVQGTITAAGLHDIDPRDLPRVRVSMVQWNGTGQPADTIAGLWVGTADSIAAGFTPQTADAIAQGYLTPFDPGEAVVSTSLTADLFLMASSYDQRQDQTTLKVSSDEARAFLLSLTELYPHAFGSLSLRAVVSQVLGYLDASLQPGTTDAVLDEAVVWQPGATAWDLLQPLCTSHDCRLYCDERRAWWLVGVDDTMPGSVTLSDQATLTEAVTTVDLTADWGDSFVIQYEWIDDEGQPQVKVDAASVARPSVTQTRIYRRTRWPGAGAAAVMLRRAQLLGLAMPVKAVARYDVRPTQAITVNTLGQEPKAGMVQRVSWSTSDYDMSIDVYGMEAIGFTSVRAIPDSYQTDQLPGTTASLDPRQL